MNESNPDARSKYCGMCRLLKPLSSFHRMSRSPDGHQSYCSECQNAARRERRAKQQIGARAKANRERAAAELALRGSKTCARCGREEPISGFWRNAGSLDGLTPECVTCRREMKAAEYVRSRASYAARNRAAYEAQREARLAYQKQWSAENREKRLEIEARRRARKLDSKVGPIDLNALWTGSCSLCDEPIPPDLIAPHPMSRSLDHIIPLSRGGSHAQSNLQWTHLRCNIRKGARLTA